MIYYKIRKLSDPTEFVKGTPVYQSYDKTGRIFQSLGNLRTFLTGVMNEDARWKESVNQRNRIADWEIVELEMVVKQVRQPFDVIDPKKVWNMLKK
jgi:hypothetical protein